MKPLAPGSVRTAPPAGFEDKIRHLSAPAQEAFRRFYAQGDAAQLDPVVVAILDSFVPRSPERPLAEWPPETRLIEDLNFDSLSITEMVFFTEDLFDVTISNAEILAVLTLGDLREFIRRKVAARVAG